ncbi:MAG: hypothetical protein Q8P67_16225, partial [archaeon]|nr:hypothetical protein [archaeon]
MREKWARYQLDLQEALLKALFIAYYNRVSCSDRDLALLLRRLHEHKFGQNPRTMSLLDDGARETLVKIGHLGVLLLLACLNLEAYSSSSASAPTRIGSDTLRTLSDFLLAAPPCPQLGPVLLAWATLLDHYQAADEAGNILQLQGASGGVAAALSQEQQKAFGARAIQLNAIGYLHGVFADGCFENEPNLIGFQYVVYGLITAMTASFPRLTEQPLLVLLYRDAFLSNVFTSACFWEKDLPHPGRNLLFEQTRSRFPHRFSNYVELMSSLVNDFDSALRVFALLESADRFTSTFSLSVAGSEGPSPSGPGLIQLRRPCAVEVTQVYPVESASFQLEAGTVGQRSKLLDPVSGKDVPVVVWYARYSCFDIFFAIIDAFLTQTRQSLSKGIHFQQVTSILSLCGRLIPHFVQPDLLSEAQHHAFALLSRALLPRLFDVLQAVISFVVSPRFQAADISHQVLCDALKATIECIELYARHDQVRVWKYMRTR